MLKVKGGVVAGTGFDATGIERLASLPPKPVLIARLLGGLNSPAANLAGVLQGNLRQLANVLDQRRQQLEA